MRPKPRPGELVKRASRPRAALRARLPATGDAQVHGFDPDVELVVSMGSGGAPGSAPFWPIAVLMVIPRAIGWIAWSIRDRIRGGRGGPSVGT